MVTMASLITAEYIRLTSSGPVCFHGLCTVQDPDLFMSISAMTYVRFKSDSRT